MQQYLGGGDDIGQTGGSDAVLGAVSIHGVTHQTGATHAHGQAQQPQKYHGPLSSPQPMWYEGQQPPWPGRAGQLTQTQQWQSLGLCWPWLQVIRSSEATMRRGRRQV